MKYLIGYICGIKVLYFYSYVDIVKYTTEINAFGKTCNHNVIYKRVKLVVIILFYLTGNSLRYLLGGVYFTSHTFTPKHIGVMI